MRGTISPIVMKVLQLYMHTSCSVAHASIDIVWIVFDERFRDNRNVNSDFYFQEARKGFGDCLKICSKFLINKNISSHSTWSVYTGLAYNHNSFQILLQLFELHCLCQWVLLFSSFKCLINL